MAIVIMDAIVVIVIGSRCVVGVIMECGWAGGHRRDLVVIHVDGDSSCDRQSSSAHISVD